MRRQKKKRSIWGTTPTPRQGRGPLQPRLRPYGHTFPCEATAARNPHIRLLLRVRVSILTQYQEREKGIKSRAAERYLVRSWMMKRTVRNGRNIKSVC